MPEAKRKKTKKITGVYSLFLLSVNSSILLEEHAYELITVPTPVQNKTASCKHTTSWGFVLCVGES
jgi:hypothetical protein